MKKILFVCTGNTCRSPMAESILKHLIKEKNLKDIKVSSCGTNAQIGQPMSENAINALKNMNILPLKHKAKQFDEKMLENFNLILTMTKVHKDAIGNYKNVFTIGEFTSLGDISDPYGLPVENYQITAAQLLKACLIILDTIN